MEIGPTVAVGRDDGVVVVTAHRVNSPCPLPTPPAGGDTCSVLTRRGSSVPVTSLHGSGARSSRRRSAPGAGLSREHVLDAALQIVETEGIDGLTIRGLAGKLGVAATAIYWHVGDKQALLDGVAELVIAQLGEVTVEGGDPTTRIISTATSLRDTLLERPDLVALVHRRGRTAALFQPARRILVNELRSVGVDDAGVALGVQAVLNLVIGSVLLDRQLERQPTQREAPRSSGLRTTPLTPPSSSITCHIPRTRAGSSISRWPRWSRPSSGGSAGRAEVGATGHQGRARIGR